MLKSNIRREDKIIIKEEMRHISFYCYKTPAFRNQTKKRCLARFFVVTFLLFHFRVCVVEDFVKRGLHCSVKIKRFFQLHFRKCVVEDFVQRELHCSIKIKHSVFFIWNNVRRQGQIEFQIWEWLNWKCICKIERDKNFWISR